MRTVTREHARLQKELTDIQSQPSSDVGAAMVGGELHRWKGFILGPEGTPYEGGKFTLDIQVPPDYPYNPPKIQFETKIWHPNISSQTGAICLDILKSEWSPALTIRTALLSIQALLSAPEPDDPQDAQVAEMYKRDVEEFRRTAQTWTDFFAKNPPAAKEDKVKKLIEMGFSDDAARIALSKHNWDENLALNSLLEGA